MTLTQATVTQFIEQVKGKAKWYLSQADFVQLLQEVEEYLLGKTTKAPNIHAKNYGWYMEDPLYDLLSPLGYWNSDDEKIRNLLGKKKWHTDWKFWEWAQKQVKGEQAYDTTFRLAEELKNHGSMTEKEAFSAIIPNLFLQFYQTDSKKLSSAGHYALAMLPSYTDAYVKAAANNGRTEMISFLLEQGHENTVYQNVNSFMTFRQNEPRTDVMKVLLNHNTPKYEPFLEKEFENTKGLENKWNIMLLLAEYFPEKYQTRQYALAYEILQAYKHKQYNPGRWSSHLQRYQYLVVDAAETLAEKDADNFRSYVPGFMQDIKHFSNINLLKPIEKTLKADSVVYLAQVLEMLKNADAETLKPILELLARHDYSAHEDSVWALTKSKSKRTREIAAVALSKLGARSIARAKELLSAKAADQRQTGALILTLIKTDESRQILLEALNAEKNDDTRDVMLQSLAETVLAGVTENSIFEMVKSAQLRGKLDQPVEAWLDEANLPKLTYLSGNELDMLTVRFLLYRMSRTKEMRPDAEAKPILQHIDRETSGAFAKKVFKLFIDYGADSKQKYCLALAGLLGDDDVIDSLRAAVNRWVTNTAAWHKDANGNYYQTGEAARHKMAEYAVGALALIGTNKALRAVEFFSRKYKNKSKNVGTAATQALIVAAEEMGISMYELADIIIPDLGFEGLFKHFTVGYTEYRAFVGNDFKIQFFDEDNKLLKSLPKASSAELKEEFKEIGKEIRDVVKSQSDRLEQYMVIQRRWKLADWDRFFRNNPIMFVYAMKLIWGIYNAQGNLKQTFLCQEDTSLIDLEDEEINVSEQDFIGMVHPLHLSEDERQAWTQKLYDYGIEPIFEQMTRPIISLEPEKASLKMLHEFEGKTVNAYSFVGSMEKFGWTRGSVVDAGSVSAYRKIFAEAGMEAFLEVDNICVGYLDLGDAELKQVYFVKKGSVAIGSYTYDEPRDKNDDRLIRFSDIPAIVYSETIGDLKRLPFVEEKKTQQENTMA